MGHNFSVVYNSVARIMEDIDRDKREKINSKRRVSYVRVKDTEFDLTKDGLVKSLTNPPPLSLYSLKFELQFL